MKFSRKRWFTLREILVIIIIISIGLLSIVSVLTYGINYVQKSRQKIIAVNLAREGIEAVYEIRNTNWQRWAGMKEQCRLKTDPLVDELTPWCADDTWMQSGSYILSTNVFSGQQYFLLTGYTSDWLDLGQGITTGDLHYSLCLTSGARSACPGTQSTTPEGTYFREIEGYGLWEKDLPVTWGQYISCTSGMDIHVCGAPLAKEYRFCSKVVYVGYGTGEVDLCGVVTNFMKK